VSSDLYYSKVDSLVDNAFGSVMKSKALFNTNFEGLGTAVYLTQTLLGIALIYLLRVQDHE
jgi:hypothetical protein